LLGLAVALAVLVLGQGGARPAAAAPPAEPHYKCYDIVGTDPPDTVSVKTQFGVEPGVAVGQATKLCLPAGKNGQPIPTAPYLKCYNISGQDAKRWVNLETQFGLEREVLVHQALELCVPASRTADPPLATPNYECYTIAGPAPAVTPVDLLTDFGLEEDVVVGQPARLCLPAGVNSSTIPAVPHLKCYTIDGPPPDPAVVVDLKTQFPIENGVVVGPATRLCLPATKQLLTVGGIAEGSGLAATSAEQAGTPAEGSGWSAGAYAALAAGLATVAVALSAGAWYARRRFSRS